LINQKNSNHSYRRNFLKEDMIKLDKGRFEEGLTKGKEERRNIAQVIENSQTCAEIFKQSMGARNRVGIGMHTGPSGYIGWRN
jgi:hypothetical protein